MLLDQRRRPPCPESSTFFTMWQSSWPGWLHEPIIKRPNSRMRNSFLTSGTTPLDVHLRPGFTLQGCTRHAPHPPLPAQRRHTAMCTAEPPLPLWLLLITPL